MTDPRLEGTWRSDASRTMAEWLFRHPMPDEQAAKLRLLFGHLRVTFTGQRVVYDFSRMPLSPVDRASTSGRYSVVARDATSVVILAPVPDSEVPVLAHLRFEGADVYWIHTELVPLREYFSREPAEPS